MKIVKLKENDKIINFPVYSEEEKNRRKMIKIRLCSILKSPDCVFSYCGGRKLKDESNLIKEFFRKYNCLSKYQIRDIYFDIDLTKLFQKLKKHIDDTKIIKEIQDVLCEERDLLNICGISPANPLSPVLANIYLMDFDLLMQKRNEIKYVRLSREMFIFSDDGILLDIDGELRKLDLTFTKQTLHRNNL